jgi:pentatricopeptide repeat protein
VQVTGFTEIASKLVKYAVNVGDRILAVDSSLGGSMWPVSTTAGVISACTSRLPGQSVTMRFERSTVNMVEEPPSTVSPSSSASVSTRSATLPTTGEATAETLLKRCRDVLRKYNTEEQQNERTKFSDKYAVPALVADKVLDAVASASVSLDAKTLSLVMNAYLSCKQPTGAIRAFEAAVGISADGSSSPATTIINGKEKGTLVPNYGALNVYTVSSLMRAHSILNDTGSVFRVLAALEGKSGLEISGKKTGSWPYYGSMLPDTQLYNIALSAAAKSGESSSLEDVFALFNSMEDRSGREGRPVKDRVSYNTVINALTKAGKYEESFTSFYTMKRSGIKPDQFTYTSLVKACVREGDLQELLFDMREKGVKPDLVMYNFMIKILCEGGQWYEAKKLVTQMEAAGIAPDSMTYGFLMNGLLTANKPSACLSLFEAACADSKTISLTENVHLYTTAITAASALENHEKAFFLINRMKIAGVKPNIKTLTALMGACMSSGKYTLATEVYRQVEKPDSFAMSKGVEAFCLNGDFEEAFKILSDKECVKGLSGKQQMMAYGHLLRTSLAGGNMKVGRATLKAFLGAGFIPSKLTFQLIIQALGMVPPKKKNLPFAKQIPDENFDFALFVLDSIRNRNLPCDIEFYSSVLLAGSRIGGLRRKICSLMTESRAHTEEPQSKQSQKLLDENNAAELSLISWEELLNNYDARKADLGVNLRLPSLTVRLSKEDIRQVLSAEQQVTYRGGANRKSKVENRSV